MRETYLVIIAVLIAIFFLLGGTAIAILKGSPDWVSRAGAAVVCAEGLIAIAEHRMKARFERIEKDKVERNPFLKKEMEKAEARVFGTALMLAVGGEAIHGFGDLIFETGKTLLEKML